MDLRQLRYFVKVVECGNITRASQALYIAQPAISQQLLNLERELQMQLLDRSARGVAPVTFGWTSGANLRSPRSTSREIADNGSAVKPRPASTKAVQSRN
ncbi:MAG: LysR family transcriptional regulator, partial [Steroidobacteraceae bacterium]